jgi:hypothetical protein
MQTLQSVRPAAQVRLEYLQGLHPQADTRPAP